MTTLAEYCGGSAFSWPGGYPTYAIMDDGAALCHACTSREEEVHVGGDADGWRYEGADIHWEGDPLICSHCGEEIPSAYGGTDKG